MYIEWIELTKRNACPTGVKHLERIIVVTRGGWIGEARYDEIHNEYIRLVGSCHYESVEKIYERGPVIAYMKLPKYKKVNQK